MHQKGCVSHQVIQIRLFLTFYLSFTILWSIGIHAASVKLSSVISSAGKWKIYDPVENNDFWWYSKDEKPHE